MPKLRRAADRGQFDHGWLDTRHTFSFGEYVDPQQMGFRVLRVINEDRVRPGQGFPTHSHRDMEILTCVLDGALEHKDSMGNGTTIRPGDVQRMSAGTGVTHSEFNASHRDPVHFLQIWILPERNGLAPGYEQRSFPADTRRNRLVLVGSRDGEAGSVTIHQNVRVYSALLETGATLHHPLEPGRHAWIQVARGSLEANGAGMEAGDGAALSDEASLRLTARDRTDLLVFDLP